ncbi:MAG: hypothetical protein IKN25_00800 [Spirochaetales bacterium]|nr:hypothetical protein [Spirochaetales bacterium]
MNRNFYAVAMATVMTAICFAGCSNAPVEESDTGTESSAIESSIFAESSVKEAESSVVTEVQAEKDVLDAAKAYGMTQVGDHQEMINLWGGFDSASVYYIAKDSDEATALYSSIFNLDGKSFPDVKVNEMVMCIDKNAAESNGRSTTSEIYEITLADNASAQALYEAFSQKKDSYRYSSGTANGYTYMIGYYESANGCVAVGTFIKDDVVIRMLSIGDFEAADKCISFFCGELGFESPLMLK